MSVHYSLSMLPSPIHSQISKSDDSLLSRHNTSMDFSYDWRMVLMAVALLLLLCVTPIAYGSTFDNFILGRKLDVLRKFLETTKSAPNIAQTNAVQDFHKLYHRSVENIANDIRAYFRLFDTLFFNGSLKNKCTVRVVGKLSTLDNGIHAAVTWVDLSRSDSCHIEIKIRAYPERNPKDSYLSLLLHEMVHVYFGPWHAHGVMWQEAARDMEVVGQFLLGHKFDLRRENGLAHNMAKRCLHKLDLNLTGGGLPSGKNLVELERTFKPSDVRPGWDMEYNTLLQKSWCYSLALAAGPEAAYDEFRIAHPQPSQTSLEDADRQVNPFRDQHSTRGLELECAFDTTDWNG